MKILSTKLLSEEELKIAANLQLEITCLPTIRITFNKFNTKNIENNFDTILFTSSNAVNYFFENIQNDEFIKNSKIVSIAEKTALTLKTKKNSIYKCGKNIKEITELINTDPYINSIIHPCGNLSTIIETQKNYMQLVVYNNTPIYVNKISEKYDAVMIFSPSGVKGFIKNNLLNNETIYCCVGKSTANYLSSFNTSLNIIVAEKTDAVSMLLAIKNNQ